MTFYKRCLHAILLKLVWKRVDLSWLMTYYCTSLLFTLYTGIINSVQFCEWDYILTHWANNRTLKSSNSLKHSIDKLHTLSSNPPNKKHKRRLVSFSQRNHRRKQSLLNSMHASNLVIKQFSGYYLPRIIFSDGDTKRMRGCILLRSLW